MNLYDFLVRFMRANRRLQSWWWDLRWDLRHAFDTPAQRKARLDNLISQTDIYTDDLTADVNNVLRQMRELVDEGKVKL